MIDLHTHSTMSDGEFTPEAVVDMAKEIGLTALAVSDHDTLAGSKRAIEHGKKIGVTVIPAVELSAVLHGKPIHILGYYIDLESAAFENRLKEIQGYRIQRAKHLVIETNKELAAEGKVLMDLEYVLSWGKEKPITRPDMGDYLVKLGNAQNRQEAFDRWLEKYNLPNQDLSAKEAIELVHAAGGIAVLAHPNSKFISLWAIDREKEAITRMLGELKMQGLDGLEVHRTEHTAEDEAWYKNTAESLGLLPAGGSDFHGPKNWASPDRIAAVEVPDEVLKQLLAAHRLFE